MVGPRSDIESTGVQLTSKDTDMRNVVSVTSPTPTLDTVLDMKNHVRPPQTPGLSTRLAELELEEEECVCRLECPGHGEEDEDGSDECVCNMRCEEVASNDDDRGRKEEYALGIKYCPGIETILPSRLENCAVGFWRQDLKPFWVPQ